MDTSPLTSPTTSLSDLRNDSSTGGYTSDNEIKKSNNIHQNLPSNPHNNIISNDQYNNSSPLWSNNLHENDNDASNLLNYDFASSKRGSSFPNSQSNSHPFESKTSSIISSISHFFQSILNSPTTNKFWPILKSLLISIILAPWWIYNKFIKSISNVFIYIFTFKFLKSKNGLISVVLIATILINSYQILELDKQKLDDIRIYKPYKPNTNFTYYDADPVDSLTFYEVFEILDHVGDFNSSPAYIKNDKRLVPAIYLNEIKHAIERNNNQLSKNFTINFSWADWLDFDERFKYGKKFKKSHNDKPFKNCQDFRQAVGYSKTSLLGIAKHDDDLLTNCTDLSWKEIKQLPNNYYPRFKISAPKDVKMTPHARILHGSSYVYYSMDPPKRIIYTDGLTNTNIIITVSNNKPILPSVFTKSMIKTLKDSDDYINNFPSMPTIFNDISNIIDPINYHIEYEDKGYIDKIVYDYSRININSKFETHKTGFKLKRDDYKNIDDINQIKKKLKHFRKIGSLDNILYSNILNQKTNHPNREYSKYFHEPEIFDKSNQIEGSHYDWRFYNTKEKFPEYKKVTILSRIIRAWLRFTNNENIDTWLAHGTLLGHSFNKMMLPWDTDHDVQISSEGMWKLAKYFNQSIIIDTTLDDQYSSGYGQYFLDIGSSFFDRDTHVKNNVIDARFIDIHTGMYIDITQIAETHHKDRVVHGNDNRVGKNMMEEFELTLKHYNLTKDEIIKEKDLFSCKNYHLYTSNDLSDFKRETFMGEYAFVQSVEESLLDREFQRRHEEMNFSGHTWRENMRMWVDNDMCKTEDRKGDTCLKDPYENLMFKLTFPNGKDDIITDRRVIYPDWEGVISTFRQDFGEMYKNHEEKD